MKKFDQREKKKANFLVKLEFGKYIRKMKTLNWFLMDLVVKRVGCGVGAKW